MTNKSNSENREPTIDDIINEIKSKSSNGDYIYRGERQLHCKVSSALYREHDDIDIEYFDLRNAQREILKAAKKHIGEPPQAIYEDYKDAPRVRFPNVDHRRMILKTDEIEILTELQHYGGKTNLIDFTTDYLIAIYFACAGEPKVDGRVIVLEKTEEIESMIIRPYNPRHRVVAQKSIFLYPPKGFVDVPDDKKIVIPFTLKQLLLTYLRKHHDISAETIYNDIHGFITNQNIHKSAYIEFNMGLTFHYRGHQAKIDTDRKEFYKEAIKHYDSAIELNSEDAGSYYNRGECLLHLGKLDQGKKDIKIAKDMGLDIISSFHNDYKNVEDFEKRTRVELPPDITEMLGD